MTEPEALLALQDVDVQVMRINAQLAEMPQQRRIRELEQSAKKLAGQLKTIIGQRKDAVMDLEDNEAAHAEVMEKISQVKSEAAERAASFRQTRDVEAHLTALAKRQEKLEFAYEQLAAQVERAETAERNARALGQRMMAEREAQLTSFNQQTSDLQARLRQLAGRRKALLNDITPEVAARYEQASKRFGGLAVESVNLSDDGASAPSVCRVSLQPSLVSDVRRGGSIIECPYCHRILVIRRAAS